MLDCRQLNYAFNRYEVGLDRVVPGTKASGSEHEMLSRGEQERGETRGDVGVNRENCQKAYETSRNEIEPIREPGLKCPINKVLFEAPVECIVQLSLKVRLCAEGTDHRKASKDGIEAGHQWR